MPTAQQRHEKLMELLKELFQLDQADLDFGIYRIMNAKRGEITHFLDHDLLPQVRQTLDELDTGGRVRLRAELDAAVEQARTLQVDDPSSVPKVRDLQAKYDARTDVAALEAEVFSHMATFFRRYYHEGDFISLRRYKPGVYAIPYEGEEVKLHWANADQYYVKSSEYLRDYTFRVPDGRSVHFKVVAAEEERDNTKAAAGKERRFILTEQDAVSEQNGDLIIRFGHRPDQQKRKQNALNTAASEIILRVAPLAWAQALSARRPTEANPSRTLLDKHLADFTAKNTFDYFIHKDLGGFLRRELDFYIKNEVMHLDDIESEAAPRIEAQLAKIKAIRRIAHKIIAFLAQLEDFQKKLWLKKKFVVETSWCVTLDRVPEELYPEIATNDAQRDEWVRLFAIDEIHGDTTTPPYSEPFTVDFLKANPHLVLATRFFPQSFTQRLLAHLDDLDEQIDGLLVHSENFQALSLLQPRYQTRVHCIYVDPPYNTSENTFLYKNAYKHSSWIAMIRDRLEMGRRLLPPEGVLQCAIDDTETAVLRAMLDSLFGETNRVATIAVEVNPAGQNLRPNTPALSHDYCHIYSSEIDRMEMLLRDLSEEERSTYKGSDSRGPFLWDNLRRRGGNSRPADRPGQWYPLFVDRSTKRVSVDPLPGAEEVWPIDPKGEPRIWRMNPDGARRDVARGEISVIEKAGRLDIVKKTRMSEGKKPKTLWSDSRYSATTHGTKLLISILGEQGFSYPKSVNLVMDCLRYWCEDDSLTLDFFAGSGTTGHAVINLNREDGGARKFILAEMGQYFDTALKPRILKVVYSKDWKDGKPVSRQGSSALIKVIRLESYEDTLNNLELRKDEAQQRILSVDGDLREGYMLRYMVDVESRGSLLNLDRFADPFAHTLKVATGSVGETREVAVDLVETFNYLLDLRVKHVDVIRGVTVVDGTDPQGQKVLVLWRKTAETSNDALDSWFQKQGYNTRDQEYDLIYVNGGNNLENLRRADHTWKVRLIEEEFQRLMFDTHDV